MQRQRLIAYSGCHQRKWSRIGISDCLIQTRLEGKELGPDKKQALMALTRGPLENLAQRGKMAAELLKRIKRLLQLNAHLYADLIGRWNPSPSDPDGFLISEMMKSIGSAHQD